MTTKAEIKDASKEVINNNMNEEAASTDMDVDKLNKLKAKLASKKMPIVKKERSINFGIIGSGAAGSKLCESMYKLGYDAVAINTAGQDLKFIEIPDTNKLLISDGLGGASKDLSIGHAAAEKYRDQISELVNKQLADAQMLILCTSLAGGSGAGSVDVMIDILNQIGKPLAVITILPMNSEDAQAKSNALLTLSKLAKYAQTKKIHNLIVVDNAKIESIYSDVSQMDFFDMANKAIVEPLDVFNTLSMQPSKVKALDSMEFAKLMTDSEGLTVYGEIKVSNYQEETAIAEAVINNLDSNLLASGFDLSKSKYVGIMMTANKEVWKKIPSSFTHYAQSMINEIAGNPVAIFKGIYEVDNDEDAITVWSMFSGLSLPEERVEQLKKETKDLAANNKSKEQARNLSLKIDTGTESTISEAEKIKERIKQKSSAFGKLLGNSIVDKRK